MPAEPPITATTIAANVRAEVARTRTSQANLAAILNLSQSSVSMRLRGATPFSAHELATIATHLDIPVNTFYQHTTTAA